MHHRCTLVAVSTALAFGLGTATPAFAANPVVEMQIEGRGKVAIELYQKDAPKTVAHFLQLCKSGFYDGIRFHRIVPGFVAQGGDPGTRKLKAKDLATELHPADYRRLGIGNGGSGKPTPFESNSRVHDPGALSLALTAPKSATGDSQFFIDLVRNERLDGDYCVFGHVTKGMDVVQKIQQGDKILKIAEVKAESKPTKKAKKG
jgi:peptidyl-prolyl cis-trans isomerase B (cyclophilin B)